MSDTPSPASGRPAGHAAASNRDAAGLARELLNLDRADRANLPDSNALKLELQTMMNRELGRGQRVFFCLVALASLAGGVLMLVLAVTENLPPVARGGLLMGTAFSTAWVGWVVSVLRRGRLDVRKDGRRTANMAWVFTLFMAVLMVVGANTRAELPDRVLIIINTQALFFLICAGVYFLAQRIEQSELDLRERLIRLEMRLSENAE